MQVKIEHSHMPQYILAYSYTGIKFLFISNMEILIIIFCVEWPNQSSALPIYWKVISLKAFKHCRTLCVSHQDKMSRAGLNPHILLISKPHYFKVNHSVTEPVNSRRWGFEWGEGGEICCLCVWGCLWLRRRLGIQEWHYLFVFIINLPITEFTTLEVQYDKNHMITDDLVAIVWCNVDYCQQEWQIGSTCFKGSNLYGLMTWWLVTIAPPLLIEISLWESLENSDAVTLTALKLLTNLKPHCVLIPTSQFTASFSHLQPRVVGA